MTSKDTYDNCLQTMYGLRRFGIKLGLSTIREILAGLGNPQRRFKCIHVAGTNGKGSIASSLASILHASGYNVGLYTSPHLVRFNERICINNRPIPNENVVKAHKAIQSVHHGNRQPTFFEFATAMALYEFGRQQIDWAVIETGMGGRLDATNVIKPSLAIITNISLEHRMYLGNTIGEIAAEKGGIIKRHCPVVTGARQKTAISVLEKLARMKSAPMYRLGKDFRVRRNHTGTFTYFGIKNVWRKLRTELLGDHQVDNAALVLAASEVLNNKHVQISLQNVRDGLKKTAWPGRLEIVANSPLIILDGAHNLAAAQKLAQYLSTNLKGRKLTFVIGILDDKPYQAMLRSLLPVCNRVIITRSRIDRALSPEILRRTAQKFVTDIKIIPDVDSAVKYAVDTTPPEDAICVAGSLYVVGEAKEFFEKQGMDFS
ncbi:bifunctional folylpolyglutamate synthase/dihydrofolate synthase [Thermodesulfobacteriota bacterium]